MILAIPGAAVSALAAEHGDVLERKLVVDATNQMGQSVSNARSALPAKVRYARAFNTLGGENLADPMFADGPADMFFSAPSADLGTTESVIEGVGLRPIFTSVKTKKRSSTRCSRSGSHSPSPKAEDVASRCG